MLKRIIVFLVIGLLAGACKKSKTDTTVVQYQVTATNSSGITVVYNNILGQKTQAIVQNSWTYDITGPEKPFTAYVQASSSSPFGSVQTTCTVTILVNGASVKTATNTSNTTAVATAEYLLQ